MKDIWKDPSLYDGMTDGPPYLPKPGAGLSKLASGTSEVGKILAALVAWHRAAFFVHQTHHWQTRGPSYYGDHQLFMRIYEEIDPLIDQLAERAIGVSGDPSVVSLGVQMTLMGLAFNTGFSDAGSPEEMPGISLYFERRLLEALERAYATLEQQDALSMGVDDLLQAIASKHEEFVYLLQQRSRTADDPWKL